MSSAASKTVPLEDRAAEVWTALSGCEVVCDYSGCLYLPFAGMLVVSDLHLEKGSSFAARGRMVPPYDTLATLDRLAARLLHWRPRLVVSLGDSFHREDSSALMPEPFRQKLAAMMAGRDWIWISGNHDPAPPRGLGGVSATEISAGALTFRHEPRAGPSNGEIAGHLHPAARIFRRGKSVRRPCFATDGERMILPAFGAYAGGLDLGDRAYRGLFDNAKLHAHLLGRGRIYTVRGDQLA